MLNLPDTDLPSIRENYQRKPVFPLTFFFFFFVGNPILLSYIIINIY